MSRRVSCSMLLVGCCLFAQTAAAQNAPPSMVQGTLVSVNQQAVTIDTRDGQQQFALMPQTQMEVRGIVKLADVPLGTPFYLTAQTTAARGDVFHDWRLTAYPGLKPPGGFSIESPTELKHFFSCVLQSKDPLVFASMPNNAKHLRGLVVKLEQADAAQFPYYRADMTKGEVSIYLGQNSNLIGKDPMVRVQLAPNTTNVAAEVTFIRTETLEPPKSPAAAPTASPTATRKK